MYMRCLLGDQHPGGLSRAPQRLLSCSIFGLDSICNGIRPRTLLPRQSPRVPSKLISAGMSRAKTETYGVLQIQKTGDVVPVRPCQISEPNMMRESKVFVDSEHDQQNNHSCGHSSQF